MATPAQTRQEELAERPDEDALIHRVSGDLSAPPLVYLPGVHGDWTPQTAAGPILAKAFHLIEITYPKNPNWTLDDFVDALRRLLDSLEIPSANIAAESFGSLVGWEFGLEHPGRIRTLTLVGGFCRAPEPRMIRMAKWGLGHLPTNIFERGVDTYVALRKRQGTLHPRSMEVDLPYDAVRTEEGRQATIRRFELISQTDLRHQLHHIKFPVRYIGGEHDIIVPVKREIRTLEELLPKEAAFQSRLIPKAPHMIIASHPQETAQQIIDWIQALAGHEGK